MTDHPATYPPLDQPKPVTDGVWIVDSGPMRVMGVPIPVRMTVLRLQDGGLWLHSPTAHSPALQQALEALGPIRHLVAPNVVHWSFLEGWQRHCPGATLWAPPALRARAAVRRSALRVERDLEPAAPDAWAAEISQDVIPGGHGFQEIAFLHRASRTLILTDLVQRFEPRKMPLVLRPMLRLLGNAAPRGGAPLHLRAVLRPRRTEVAAALDRILDWAPQRVIFAHGAWFDRDGAAALRLALAPLLR